MDTEIISTEAVLISTVDSMTDIPSADEDSKGEEDNYYFDNSQIEIKTQA